MLNGKVRYSRLLDYMSVESHKRLSHKKPLNQMQFGPEGFLQCPETIHHTFSTY